jgi:Putative transposase/Transposase zinc-binding domain
MLASPQPTQELATIRQLLQTQIFSAAKHQSFNSYSKAIFSKISKCHTAAIGLHYLQCNATHCNHAHTQYHSCQDRHCPNCGGLKREQWLQDRMSELLPTTYFHIVFTLPQELRSLVMGNRKVLFNLLFDAAHHTLNTLGQDARFIGGKPGIVSILHSNGQDLSFHPHVHCIVSGGGINVQGLWVKEKRANGMFLFPRRAMEKIYKTYFLQQLAKLVASKKVLVKDAQVHAGMLENIGNKKWNVYAKAPFGGPAQIVEYLGRYTHKVAITAHRITSITSTHISFHYKDYSDGSKRKEMTLTYAEFLRRFEQHILPKRFVKIRHAGYLSHQGKNARIAALHRQLQLPKPMPKVIIPFSIQMLQRTGTDYSLCPHCKKGTMQITASFININGVLINVEKLGQQRNKASPLRKAKGTPLKKYKPKK